jgi:hypothetical protein
VKAGDLVRARDGDSGIILSISYVVAGQYWVMCLWCDGTVEGLEKSDIVEVINESR